MSTGPIKSLVITAKAGHFLYTSYSVKNASVSKKMKKELVDGQ